MEANQTGEALHTYHLRMQRRYIALIIADSGISIHAAREGGDEKPPYHTNKDAKISIHAAREGGDHRQ